MLFGSDEADGETLETRKVSVQISVSSMKRRGVPVVTKKKRDTSKELENDAPCYT